MAKPHRPSWFKMFSHQRAVIEATPSFDVGEGLKAAFRYFDGEDIDCDNLSQAAFTIFAIIRPYIDEAMQDYRESVEAGRAGGNKRWGNKSPF